MIEKLFMGDKPHWFWNGVFGFIVSAMFVMWLFGLGEPSPTTITATAAVQENDISIYYENGESSTGIATYVVIDKATGVHYVVVGSMHLGSAVAITPRLTSEGEIYVQEGY